MGYNLQPFEEIEMKRIERVGASETGNDGGTPAVNNVSRTLPVAIYGRPFTIILEDATRGLTGNLGNVSGYVKVQVNNRKYINPNLEGHQIHPSSLGIASVATNLRRLGALQIEPSTTSNDFATGWKDMPGGAIINHTVSAYMGSGAWRYIRLVGAATAGAIAHLPPTLTAHLYHTGTDATGK